ncbi:hypothetical protein BpHYR1_040370 [Brachionus plicatilis]|uniref:Endonuclease/exonuclease/phosphatase domain-containing protein n=1 Tax=Brachionus plicatilis TaxID=10195 RepID=A0A3M7SDL2_BRAPC|nr:hypothetical protein BpHYR1_040370 [Brachionus plicatilis]
MLNRYNSLLINIYNNIRIEISNFQFYENRIVNLDLKINGNIFSFENIYAPNLEDEQSRFIEELYRVLYGKKLLIFGGDFNNHFEIDKIKIYMDQWFTIFKNRSSLF